MKKESIKTLSSKKTDDNIGTIAVSFSWIKGKTFPGLLLNKKVQTGQKQGLLKKKNGLTKTYVKDRANV